MRCVGRPSPSIKVEVIQFFYLEVKIVNRIIGVVVVIEVNNGVNIVNNLMAGVGGKITVGGISRNNDVMLLAGKKGQLKL